MSIRSRASARVAAFLAVPAILLSSAGLAGPALASPAKPPVPVAVGFCNLHSANVAITGGRAIAHATVICRRKPDHFRIGLAVQFRHGRKWVTRSAAFSETAPFTWDPLGRAYLIRTDCLRKTRIRVQIVVQAIFGLHHYIRDIDYPGRLGTATGNCDEL